MRNDFGECDIKIRSGLVILPQLYDDLNEPSAAPYRVYLRGYALPYCGSISEQQLNTHKYIMCAGHREK